MGHPRLVVGIGNPGARYEGTRHNVGFEVVDKVATLLRLVFTHEAGRGWVARGQLGGEPFVLLKPDTYVNLTGPAVRAMLDECQATPDGVLVVLDDMALAPGRVRFRAGGSHGGHNGLRSVIDALQTESVPRLRIGIGSVPAESWREHVLSPFSPAERLEIDTSVLRAADGVRQFLMGTAVQRIAAETNRSSPGVPNPGTGDAGVRSEGCDGPPDRGERGD